MLGGILVASGGLLVAMIASVLTFARQGVV
jgi:hypothetical protein